MTEESKELALNHVSRSVEKFMVHLYQNLARKINGNFVSSPLSAHVVLSMAASGADGTTAQQMKEVLHLPENDSLAQRGFQELIEHFTVIEEVILKMASKIYFAKDIDVKDKFMEITRTYFRSEAEKVDFSKKKETVNSVNQWGSNETNGKINELLEADSINENTKMILLNAVYFKGNWKDKFMESYTQMKPFYLDKNTSINVPTMHKTDYFYYKELETLEADCIGLPYKNEDLLMIIIVPREIDGLKSIEENLHKMDLDYNDLKSYEPKLDLALPKFKIETTINLNQHLVDMGMGKIFGDDANFLNISDEPLKVDKVVQKSFVEINEKGTEATTLSDITMLMCAEPIIVPITVNKPFLYKVSYKNTTLFCGRVINPIG